ncbi:hypothetical protein ACPPVT_12255 [Angustibacter sp. McL0619]|uniref:hypothetical protein n=1 Tax=Angustibacter sp. McL0619 TaxID=3415676 RepID=UPI003CEAC1EC
MSAANTSGFRARRPSVVAAVFGVVFLGVYVWLVLKQGDVGVAWFYVVLVLAAIGCSVATAVTRSWVSAAVASVLFAVCMILGLASIGILLLPATVLAIIALSFSRTDRAKPGTTTSP